MKICSSCVCVLQGVENIHFVVRGWGEVKTDFKASAPWGSEISYCYYYCVMRTMMLFFFFFWVNIKFTNTMLPFYDLSKAPGAGDFIKAFCATTSCVSHQILMLFFI